ncbi:MAG: hypothetical protein NVS4B1_00610 [Ktedonobacteraceae bacterium]
MSNTFDKMSVLESFIEEVNSYLPDIETNLEHLAQLAQSSQATSDMDAIEETYRRTHSIGGSASMMDFPGLAHVAHGMEDILGDALESIFVLDIPTIALLQRSLGRLQHLLAGIRNGINEEEVIAEDDADYVRYRAARESTATSQQDTSVNEHQAPSEVVANYAVHHPEEALPTSSMPSFDEVLASFRTSALTEDDKNAWPEEPVQSTIPVASHEEIAQVPTHELVLPVPAQVSALDTLVASTRQNTPLAEVVPPVEQDVQPVYDEHALGVLQQEENVSLVAQKQALDPRIMPSFDNASLPQAYVDVQNDAQSVVAYATSLRNITSQLRSAMIIIDDQRNEFRGFLDGSKDALERMEDWAGKAMGLNLKNSPEQVRRYLPLSVMWVSNTKLKKVLELLTQATNGIELTDEQMHSMLEQLTTSIAACGEAFQHLQENTAAHLLTQEPGWTAWEMQTTRDVGVQERVTFERRGDLDRLRAEVEANVREELHREYDARNIATLAAQAELERRIRKEVRQELEEQRSLQERASGSSPVEARQELESRLRNEIEIQVRQEFLQQIDANTGIAAESLMPPAQPAPTTSNFADRARQATGVAPRDEQRTATSESVEPATSTISNSTVPTPSASTTSQTLVSSVTNSNNNTTAQHTSPVSVISGDFGEEAAEIFRLEAEEHLQTISTYVAGLEKEPTNREFIQGIRRATHTLKGAAAMMGFRAIAELSHVSEDLLDNIMEGKTSASSDALSIILDTAETLDILITGKDTDNIPDEARVQALRVRYVELLGEQAVSLSTTDEDIDEAFEESEDERVTEAAIVTGVISEQSEVGVQHANRDDDLSVRVRLQKLDELVNLFGELLVNRSVLEERIERLVRLVSDVGISSNRLRDVGQKLESRFEAATLPSGRSVVVMPGEGKQSNMNGKNGKNTESPYLDDFDALEMDRYTEFHQVARGLSEGISDMSTLSAEMDKIIRECEGVFARENRLSTTLQDRLMKTRLVPLSTMTPRLYRAARAVALKQHKEFEFLLEGEETEIDRTVVEEIAGPLLHLIRNAVNHGIESPEVRIQRGKTPKGQITLAASYEGNQVVITVREDGQGIEPEQVRHVAIARGLIRPEHVLSENELIELIFRPGFSTAEVLSEESGRGVGLDVVRDSVSRLRGTIEVESTPGHGTAFTMKFPTSLAIQSAMMVRVNDQQFAIPITMVESIGRLDSFKRTTVAGQPAVVVRNDLYPLSVLAQYLDLPLVQIDDKSHVLLVNAGGNRVALVIDEVKGKLDIVMKNLGPHLRHVHGIAGGTILGNGQVVLILELTELLATRTRLVSNIIGNATAFVPGEAPQARQLPQTSPLANKTRVEGVLVQQTGVFGRLPASTSKPERGKHVLVVDDSPSVRRVVGNMLKQHGWEVQMARDGVEALEMITNETPAAVLLDVEMPRMDGYELIASVRAQEQYRTLPLVMLTSRAAAKHQQRAMQLGASAYLVKPYQDDELLNILNSHIYGTAVR